MTDDSVIVSDDIIIIFLERFQSFHMLHMMYHEATACHITGELVELLSLILDVLKCARMYRENPEVRQWLNQWKDLNDYIRKLLTLLNSYTPNDVRKMCIGKFPS